MDASNNQQNEKSTAHTRSASKKAWRSIAPSLHVKVLLAFVVVALVPLVILTLFNYIATRQALTHSANQALFAAASQTSVRLDASIAADFAVIGMEAKLPVLAKCLSALSGKCELAQVLEVLRSFSQKDAVFISSYALLDLQGHNLIDTDISSVGHDESERDYFQVALETGLPYVSSVEFDANDGKAYLYFSSTVADEITGKPLGVLRARHGAAYLQQLVVQDSGLLGARSYPVLLDESGLILADGLASPGSPSGLLYKAASAVGLADSLVQVNSLTPFFSVQRFGSTEVQAAAVTQMKMRPWLVAFLEPRETLLAPALEQARNTLALAAMIVFIVAIVAIGVARLLSNPIVHLTDVARHIAKGNLDAKAEIESNDEIGILAGAFNSMTDQLLASITSLKQRVEELDRARLALQDSEIRLRILVQTIPDLVWLKDPEGIYLTCNPQFEHFFGASEADIIGKTDYDFVDKELADFFREKDRKAVEAHRPSVNEEWVTYASNGHRALLETVKTPMLDAAGKVIGVLGIARDITERRANEDQLRRLTIFQQTILNSAAYSIISTTPDGAISGFNPASERLLGYSADEVIGKLPPALWHTTEEIEQHALRLSDELGEVISPGFDVFTARPKRNLIEENEWTFIRKDGTRVPVNLSVTAMRDEVGCIIGFLGMAYDLTERKQAENALRELTVELEARVKQRTLALESANKELAQTLDHLRQTQSNLIQIEKQAALGRLVAGVAHELNTPIGNAMMAASIIDNCTRNAAEQLERGMRRSELDALVRDIREADDIACRNLERAAHLITSFKQVAVDQESYQRRIFDLKSVIDEIQLMSSPSFKHTPYRIENNLDEKFELDSYPGPLGQIITNLITNALLHGFENREYGTICITARQAEPGWIDICVADDGQGIALELQDKLFSPFFTTKMGRGGTGLGLHIVHNLTTGILGGSITVQSTPGNGCCFTLHLPQKAPVLSKPTPA